MLVDNLYFNPNSKNVMLNGNGRRDRLIPSYREGFMTPIIPLYQTTQHIAQHMGLSLTITPGGWSFQNQFEDQLVIDPDRLAYHGTQWLEETLTDWVME